MTYPLSPIVNPRTGAVFPGVTVQSNLTLPVGTEGRVNTLVGAFIVKLPAVPGLEPVAVTDYEGFSTVNQIIIDGNGHTIDGAGTVSIQTAFESRVFAFDPRANEWKAVVFAREIDDLPPVVFSGDAAQIPPGPLVAPSSWFEPTWFIDPVNGNDANTGVVSFSPLKTFQQLILRWGSTSPPLPQATSVTFLTDQPDATDPVVCTATVTSPAAGATFTILGTLQPVPGATGTITASVARNRATATLWQITDAAKPTNYWTALVGCLVHDTTVDAWFWVVQDIGGSTAIITEPHGSAVGNSVPPYVAIGNGDAYEVVAPTKVAIANYAPIAASGEAAELRHLWQIVAGEDMNLGGFFLLTECRADGFVAQGSGGPAGGANFANCYLEGLSFCGGTMVAGAVTFELGIESGAPAIVDGDCLVMAPVFGIDQGQLIVGAAYFGAPVQIPNIQSEGAATGVLSISSGALYPGQFGLWGPNGINVSVGGEITYSAPAATAFLQLGPITIEGSTTASSYNAGTGVWTPGIFINPANLDGVFPAGFGGAAYGRFGTKVREIA